MGRELHRSGGTRARGEGRGVGGGGCRGCGRSVGPGEFPRGGQRGRAAFRLWDRPGGSQAGVGPGGSGALGGPRGRFLPAGVGALHGDTLFPAASRGVSCPAACSGFAKLGFRVLSRGLF